MRKLFALAAAAILGSALLLAGCGSDNTASAGSSGKTTIQLVHHRFHMLKSWNKLNRYWKKKVLTLKLLNSPIM